MFTLKAKIVHALQFCQTATYMKMSLNDSQEKSRHMHDSLAYKYLPYFFSSLFSVVDLLM